MEEKHNSPAPAPETPGQANPLPEMPRVLREVIEGEELKAKHARQYGALKEKVPGFNFAQEAQNPVFLQLLKSGMDMDRAYEFIHSEEIFRQNAQRLVAYGRQKALEDVAARGARPAENGVSGQSAALSRESRPGEWDREERDRIGKKLLRGQKHQL